MSTMLHCRHFCCRRPTHTDRCTEREYITPTRPHTCTHALHSHTPTVADPSPMTCRVQGVTECKHTPSVQKSVLVATPKKCPRSHTPLPGKSKKKVCVNKRCICAFTLQLQRHANTRLLKLGRCTLQLQRHANTRLLKTGTLYVATNCPHICWPPQLQRKRTCNACTRRVCLPPVCAVPRLCVRAALASE